MADRPKTRLLARNRPPDPFNGDSGAQLIRDTLHDRGYLEAAQERMVAYDGDFWMDFVAPMIDRVEDALGLALCDECQENVVDSRYQGPDGRSVCDECRDKAADG